jgi:hypothetical protein
MKTHTMTALVAGGIGYVLGARAGRARYEQIRTGFRRVTEDPRVQDVAHRAQEKAQEKAPAVAERITAAAEKVRPGSGEHAAGTEPTATGLGTPGDRRVDRTSPSAATDPVPGG